MAIADCGLRIADWGPSAAKDGSCVGCLPRPVLDLAPVLVIVVDQGADEPAGGHGAAPPGDAVVVVPLGGREGAQELVELPRRGAELAEQLALVPRRVAPHRLG